MLLALMLSGCIAGQALLSLRSVTPVLTADSTPLDTETRLSTDRQHSNVERGALLRGSVQLIQSAPITGHGLGSFERSFPLALSRAGETSPFTVTVKHPHNELLYVWSEGGLIALSGLLLWFCVWGWPFLRRRRSVTARGLLTIPLIVHCMTEMPFWLSATHAVLLLLLLKLAMPAGRPQSGRPSAGVRRCTAAGLLFVCLAGMAFMATGLQSARELWTAERFRLMSPVMLAHISNPLAQSDRLLFDLAVSDLLMYDLTRDNSLQLRFARRASHWLQRHNDANLTASLLQLAHLHGDNVVAQRLRQRGCLSFPQDPRFQCLTLSSPANTELNYE